MVNAKGQRIPRKHEQFALVLQGGGALGSYQAGVYEEIATLPLQLDWVAGVSIGAINAALIVGNPPERRIERLQAFWELVSSYVNGVEPFSDRQRVAFHRSSAAVAATVGVPGFYHPRLLPPALQPEGTDAAISVYDTTPLRETLLRLVDFDLLNTTPIRLSVGAVNVRTGNSIYFDNKQQRIGPEHIMASGALPPAFPPVTIDGEAYWDGGVVSNTPLQYVLDQRIPVSTLIAQVDLFSARGRLPRTLAETMARQKDIMYSSRTRFSTDKGAQLQRDRQLIRELIDKLPPEQRDTPQMRGLAARCHTGHVDIVHLIYRQTRYEQESKDYEFSRATVREHWAAGRNDMRHTIDHPEWLRSSSLDDGVTVYDMGREKAHC